MKCDTIDTITQRGVVVKGRKLHEQETIVLNEEDVQRQFDKSKEKAKKLLEDNEKMERFLERLEKKLAKKYDGGKKEKW